MPRWSMSELQRAEGLTKTSTSGKQQATGRPPGPLCSEPNVPDRCSQMKRAPTRADQARGQALTWPVILAARGIAGPLPPGP